MYIIDRESKAAARGGRRDRNKDTKSGMKSNMHLCVHRYYSYIASEKELKKKKEKRSPYASSVATHNAHTYKCIYALPFVPFQENVVTSCCAENVLCAISMNGLSSYRGYGTILYLWMGIPKNKMDQRHR